MGKQLSFLHLQGKYAYIESSGRLNGDRARLVVGWFKKSKFNSCLKFSYHMYGQTLGSLKISLLDSDKNQTLWHRKGDATMGDKWMRGQTPFFAKKDFMVSKIIFHVNILMRFLLIKHCSYFEICTP